MRATIVLGLALLAASPTLAQESRLVVVSGLGGTDEYRERFHGWAVDLITAARERYGVASEHIIYLAEDPDRDPERISGRSTREGLEQAVERLASDLEPGDTVFLVLFGHGSFDRDEARFNVPGPDPTAADFSLLLDRLSEQRVVLVNTTSASGPFLEALSQPGRTIITATRTGGERNETLFGGYFVEAFAGVTADAGGTPDPDPTAAAETPEPAAAAEADATTEPVTPDQTLEDDEGGNPADVNKDGRVSLLEAFNYAQQEVARAYEQTGRLQTEHAMLDDDGDGEGVDAPDPNEGDGAVAQTLFLDAAGYAGRAAAVETDDPELLGLYEERRALEVRIEELRRLRAGMDAAAYAAQLEPLLVELALKGRQIREREAELPR